MGNALQRTVARAMANRRGTAVVIGVQSGKVLAVYHPDVAARRIAHPGSSLKPFTLFSLLESGKVGPQTALVCKRSVSINGRRLDCTHPETVQPLDPAAALAYSCNSYFSTVATRLTPLELHDALLRAGFGSSTGLLANEVAGSVAFAASPEQLQLQAIGEWGVNATPIELLSAYRQLALLSEKHEPKLSPLFEGLEQSVSYGMGHPAKPSSAFRVAGKTGTSPAENGPWTHAWFVGYAPAGKPEIALVVFLEKGHGGADAASTARKIFEAYSTRKALARSAEDAHR
jgi:cell division protein FtsI/penicillin-binding protein 2